MQITNWKTNSEGLSTCKIRGISRKVGKVGDEKRAIFGSFTNVGNGIVEYSGYANDDEFTDDLIHIGAIENEEREAKIRFEKIEEAVNEAKSLTLDFFN